MGNAQLRGGGVPPLAMKWIFLGAWSFGTTLLLWGCVGLKRVRIDSSNLYISNYLRELVVPFSSVAKITERQWANIHPVTIHFKTPTIFGETIKFMPKMRIPLGLSGSHPVVTELHSHTTLGDT
jgi:hypothetical protein